MKNGPGREQPSVVIRVSDAVQQLLAIVAQLKLAFPKKEFTLDGRLVGDIGEVLVAGAYDVELFSGVQKHHDAQCSKGRRVQIKATMKKHLTFPADHTPDYMIGVQIGPDGSLTEVFNGPGRIVRKAIAKRKRPKTNLFSVSVVSLRRLQEKVRPQDRIPLREAVSRGVVGR